MAAVSSMTQQKQFAAKPNGKRAAGGCGGRQGPGSLAGDTEISFGSLGDDESVVVSAAMVEGGGGGEVPEQVLDNIGLAGFTSDEKFQLDSVLQRVNAAQALDEKRKERLRQQLQSALTQASSVQENLRSGLLYKMCELCGGKLYPFSRRYVCQHCQNLACSNCAHLLRGGGAVQCHLCHLEFVTEAQSGEWFLAEVRRRTERAYFGPEILRASLRRERRRLVSEEKARRASTTASVEAGGISQLKGSDEVLKDNDATDAVQAAVAAPTPSSAGAIQPRGKEDGKKKKKDRKEREKEKEKQKASKEEKRRDKRRKHSPEPPPPPPPPPQELPTIEVADHSADADSNQDVEIVESVQMEDAPTVEASVDVMDGDEQEQEQGEEEEEEHDESRASLPDQEMTDSSIPAVPAITVSGTDEITADSNDAAEIDDGGAAGSSNLRIVDASSIARPDKQLSLSAANNLLKRRSSAAFAAAAIDFFKSQQSSTTTSAFILSAPPRPPPPVFEIAKRASAVLFDLHIRSVLNRLQLLEKTSCESVMSNISETDESYRRGIRASGEVEISAQFSAGVLTVLVHRCRGLARIDGRQPSPYVKTYLLPDKTKRSKRRTHARRSTCSPSFGAQPLVYADLTADQLEMRILQISVWHSVTLGANLFLGEAQLPVEQCQQVFAGGRHWLPLGEHRSGAAGVSLPTLMYQGEVSISIRFECDTPSSENDGARGRLEIWLRSCRKLASATSGSATVDVSPYVKCYLLPSRHQASKRKSKTVKNNPNPEFNCMLTYNGVTLHELRERSIELTVWDHVMLGRNDFLGGVRLNVGDNTSQSWMDSRGHEQTMWTGMLKNPNKWIDGSLILRPNMDPQATHIAQ